jgi:hypothetical protein
MRPAESTETLIDWLYERREDSYFPEEALE